MGPPPPVGHKAQGTARGWSKGMTLGSDPSDCWSESNSPSSTNVRDIFPVEGWPSGKAGAFEAQDRWFESNSLSR